jgi:hypothetical protein
MNCTFMQIDMDKAAPQWIGFIVSRRYRFTLMSAKGFGQSGK